jgi:TRAP-type C4-dicarboxylate transport system permease small subunit
MRDPGEASGAPGAGRVGTVSDRLGRALAAASAAVLAALVALSAAETAAWLVAEVSWPQLAEIQGLLLVWLTFLTAAWGVHGGLHLGMELAVRRLPPVARRWAERTAAVLEALFGGLCAWHGARLASSVVNTLPATAWHGARLASSVVNTLPATGWSAAWQYLPAVAGGALIVLAALPRLATGRRPDVDPAR